MDLGIFSHKENAPKGQWMSNSSTKFFGLLKVCYKLWKIIWCSTTSPDLCKA